MSDGQYHTGRLIGRLLIWLEEGQNSIFSGRALPRLDQVTHNKSKQGVQLPLPCEAMPGSLAPLLGPSLVHCKLMLNLSKKRALVVLCLTWKRFCFNGLTYFNNLLHVITDCGFVLVAAPECSQKSFRVPSASIFLLSLFFQTSFWFPDAKHCFNTSFKEPTVSSLRIWTAQFRRDFHLFLLWTVHWRGWFWGHTPCI